MSAIKTALVAGAMAVGLLPALAQGESLMEAYKLAQQSDPKFRAAQADYRASGTAIDQARAGFLPQVKLDVENWETRQRVISSKNPIFGAGVTTFPTQNNTLSLTQPIFRKDVIERFGQAKSVVKVAEYTLLAAEQDLQLRTAAAYLVVLAAADNVAYARAEREAIGKLLDLARERLKGGLGTITAQHDALARFSVAKAREIEAEYRLRDARQGLAEITGRMIERLQTLREEFPLQTPQPPVVERWLESAFDNNLGLRAKRESVEVAKQEVERQRAGHYPSLNLLVNHNRRDAGSTLFGGGSDVETTDVILRLSVPIFEGGLTSAVTQEAAFRYQKSLEDAEQERRAVERTTRAAFDGAISGVGLVEALKQSVISQESAVESKDTGYRSGLFTILPVLDAQRDLYLARRDYAQSRYDYLFNRLKLKQAAGTLSEADLVSISAALQ
ncbi:MAG TPA: TolC family outer membrane protein [Burkholderiales bacterium]